MCKREANVYHTNFKADVTKYSVCVCIKKCVRWTKFFSFLFFFFATTGFFFDLTGRIHCILISFYSIIITIDSRWSHCIFPTDELYRAHFIKTTKNSTQKKKKNLLFASHGNCTFTIATTKTDRFSFYNMCAWCTWRSGTSDFFFIPFQIKLNLLA